MYASIKLLHPCIGIEITIVTSPFTKWDMKIQAVIHRCIYYHHDIGFGFEPFPGQSQSHLFQLFKFFNIQISPLPALRAWGCLLQKPFGCTLRLPDPFLVVA